MDTKSNDALLNLLKQMYKKELKVKKIIAKKAEKRGHLNEIDLNNVMKHLKENDFIDQHTRKVYGIDKY